MTEDEFLLTLDSLTEEALQSGVHFRCVLSALCADIISIHRRTGEGAETLERVFRRMVYVYSLKPVEKKKEGKNE